MKLKIAFILLWLVQSSNAQSVWKKFYSRPLHTSFSYQVKETYDKGFLLEAADKGLNGSYPWYGWIVKTDINGNKLWDKIIDGHKFSDFACLDITTDGGYIAGGRYDNSNIYKRDAYVMKFNACAEPEWCSLLPESNEDESIISDIYQLPEGGYICERYKPSDVDHHRWSLIKLRPNGTVEWCNYYDLNQSWVSQLDFGLTLTSDTCFLVTSIVWDSISPEGTAFDELPLWYKVDKEGNLLWEREWELYTPKAPAEARATVEDAHGNYYSGGFRCPWKFSQLFKLNHYGDTIQSYRVYDPPIATGSQINTLNYFNDTTLLIGTRFWDTPEGNHWGLSIADTIGNIRKQIYKKEQIIFIKGIVTSDDKILMLGVTSPEYPGYPDMIGLYKFNSNLEYDSIYTMPRTYDSLCPHPIVSDTIPMPGICTFVSLPEPVNKSDVLQLKVYPNPASEYVTVEIPEFSVSTTKGGYVTQQQFRPLSGEVQLSLISLSGQIVKTEEFDASERNHVMKVNALPSGLYVIHLTQKGKFVAQGKVMVR